MKKQYDVNVFMAFLIDATSEEKALEEAKQKMSMLPMDELDWQVKKVK